MNILEREGGYIGKSMSVRAKRAYDSGEKPKSKWTKQEMLEAIYNETDSDYIYSILKKCSSKVLFENCFTQSSWHHTGALYNETNFYSLNLEKLINFLGILSAEDKIDYNQIENNDLKSEVEQTMLEYVDLMNVEKKEKIKADEIRKRLLDYKDENKFAVARNYCGNDDTVIRTIKETINEEDYVLVRSDIFVIDKNKLVKLVINAYEKDALLQDIRETAKVKRTEEVFKDGDVNNWIEELKKRTEIVEKNLYNRDYDNIEEIYKFCRKTQQEDDFSFMLDITRGLTGVLLGYKTFLEEICSDCVVDVINVV